MTAKYTPEKKKWQTPTIEIIATDRINSGNLTAHHEKTITSSYAFSPSPTFTVIKGAFGIEIGLLSKNDFIS